jgi:crotonobetainyl-CoA:carnitine CoA-transferase CaiB-like acyl-CoA transferase
VVSLPLAAAIASTGILAALHETRSTGQGTRLDVNMTDSAMWVRSEDIARAANAPGPSWGTSAARNVYACADGRHVTVAASDPKTWLALCEALGEPSLADHRLGIDDDEPLQQQIAQRLRTRPAADWVAHPGLAGGVGPVNDAADLLGDPQVIERGSLVTLDGTSTQVLASPVRFRSAHGSDATCATPPPALGAHTDDLLQDAEFTIDEVAAMRAAGVVA